MSKQAACTYNTIIVIVVSFVGYIFLLLLTTSYCGGYGKPSRNRGSGPTLRLRERKTMTAIVRRSSKNKEEGRRGHMGREKGIITNFREILSCAPSKFIWERN